MIINTMQLICAAVVALASSGATYQYVAEKVDELKYPPIGKMMDIGTHKLHMVSQGEQFKGVRPTVILDIGLNGDCTCWAEIQQEIAKFAHVCSYDRAGLGWSDESYQSRTAANIVKDLHALLQQADAAEYILVGYSFGGLIAQLYATTHPEKIVGMVLVDSAHEDMLQDVSSKVLQEWHLQLDRLWYTQSWIVPFGLLRALYTSALQEKMMHSKYPQDFITMHLVNMCKSKYMRTLYSEVCNMPISFDQVRSSSRWFGDIPLTVIIAGRLDDISSYGCGRFEEYDEQTQQAFIEMCKKHKAEQAARSTNGKLVVAEKSSHAVPLEEPEVIVTCVYEMLAKICSK